MIKNEDLQLKLKSINENYLRQYKTIERSFLQYKIAYQNKKLGVDMFETYIIKTQYICQLYNSLFMNYCSSLPTNIILASISSIKYLVNDQQKKMRLMQQYYNESIKKKQDRVVIKSSNTCDSCFQIIRKSNIKQIKNYMDNQYIGVLDRMLMEARMEINGQLFTEQEDADFYKRLHIILKKQDQNIEFNTNAIESLINKITLQISQLNSLKQMKDYKQFEETNQYEGINNIKKTLTTLLMSSFKIKIPVFLQGLFKNIQQIIIKRKKAPSKQCYVQTSDENYQIKQLKQKNIKLNSNIFKLEKQIQWLNQDSQQKNKLLQTYIVNHSLNNDQSFNEILEAKQKCRKLQLIIKKLQKDFTTAKQQAKKLKNHQKSLLQRLRCLQGQINQLQIQKTRKQIQQQSVKQQQEHAQYKLFSSMEHNDDQVVKNPIKQVNVENNIKKKQNKYIKKVLRAKPVLQSSTNNIASINKLLSQKNHPQTHQQADQNQFSSVQNIDNNQKIQPQNTQEIKNINIQIIDNQNTPQNGIMFNSTQQENKISKNQKEIKKNKLSKQKTKNKQKQSHIKNNNIQQQIKTNKRQNSLHDKMVLKTINQKQRKAKQKSYKKRQNSHQTQSINHKYIKSNVSQQQSKYHSKYQNKYNFNIIGSTSTKSISNKNINSHDIIPNLQNIEHKIIDSSRGKLINQFQQYVIPNQLHLPQNYNQIKKVNQLMQQKIRRSGIIQKFGCNLTQQVKFYRNSMENTPTNKIKINSKQNIPANSYSQSFTDQSQLQNNINRTQPSCEDSRFSSHYIRNSQHLTIRNNKILYKQKQYLTFKDQWVQANQNQSQIHNYMKNQNILMLYNELKNILPFKKILLNQSQIQNATQINTNQVLQSQKQQFMQLLFKYGIVNGNKNNLGQQLIDEYCSKTHTTFNKQNYVHSVSLQRSRPSQFLFKQSTCFNTPQKHGSFIKKITRNQIKKSLPNQELKKNVASTHQTNIKMITQIENIKQKKQQTEKQDQMNIFTQDDLDLFINQQKAYNYQCSHAKNHHQFPQQRLSSSQQMFFGQIYEKIKLIKIHNMQMYEQIISFIRYPYQTVKNINWSTCLIQGINEQSFLKFMEKIAYLHKNCKRNEKNSLCMHLDVFSKKISTILNYFQTKNAIVNC